MSLLRKLGFYTVLTAALTALSWLWQGRLHAALAAEERLTEAAAALVGGLWQGLAAAVILFGAGLYLLRSRREEGKKSPDGAFFAVFGGAALALMLTMLILYGGTETASGNTAAINFMVVVWCWCGRSCWSPHCGGRTAAPPRARGASSACCWRRG